MSFNFFEGIAIICVVINVFFDDIHGLRREGAFPRFGVIFGTKFLCIEIKSSNITLDLGRFQLHLKGELFP